MKNQQDWEFASTGGGTEDGINNPMIEHFEGNYNYHLAREIIQNSLDARNDKDKPVKVSYKLTSFSQQEIPGYEKLKDVIKACVDYWKKDEKANQKLHRALDCIVQEEIPVLKISDENTNGLDGSDNDRTKPWYNLVKSRGSSSKTLGEGGSFGLGKGAPYAASDMSTVLYSSNSIEDKKSRFIGIAELVSHRWEGDTKRGNGTYGYSGQQTISNLDDLSKMGDFWRRKPGLDIYILGFKQDCNWVDELIKSILRNFWYAILSEDLIVVVGDREISFSNLTDLMSEYFVGEPYKDYVEPKGNPLYYFDSFMYGTTIEGELESLGKVKFYFKQIEERLNYVAMMRKSHMIIYSKSFHFPAPFAGVFICDDKSGNSELRKMEPPTHDKWDPARYPEKGEKLMKEIESWIRKCLKELKEKRESEVLEIPDLQKYLPSDDGADSGDGKGESEYVGEESNVESSRIIDKKLIFKSTTKIDPYKVAVLNKKDTGFGGPGKTIRRGTKKLKKHSKNSGGGDGKIKALSPEDINTRVFCISKHDEIKEYVVKVKSKVDGKCNLKLLAIGEEGTEKKKVTEVFDPRGYNYKLNNNLIKGVYLEKDQTFDLKVKIDSNIKCSLSIEAYEV